MFGSVSAFSVVSVCLFKGGSVGPCVIITHDALNLTIQGPAPTPRYVQLRPHCRGTTSHPPILPPDMFNLDFIVDTSHPPRH